MKWKQTKFEGYYVSDTGIVKRRGRFLLPIINKKGYEVVYPSSPNVEGYKTSVMIHRLVAEAFIPNPDNKPQVNHKDGNKRNNHATNLEWVTNTENHTHKIENGLSPETHMPKRVGKYDKKGNLLETFDSIYSAAQSVGVTQYGVSRVVNGLRKTCKGFVWKYI